MPKPKHLVFRRGRRERSFNYNPLLTWFREKSLCHVVKYCNHAGDTSQTFQILMFPWISHHIVTHLQSSYKINNVTKYYYQPCDTWHCWSFMFDHWPGTWCHWHQCLWSWERSLFVQCVNYSMIVLLLLFNLDTSSSSPRVLDTQSGFLVLKSTNGMKS